MGHSKSIQRRSLERIDISSMIYGRVPPQAKELEEAIIGAILIESKAYDIASEIIRPECFYLDAHRKIFEAFMFLDNNQQPIDMLTVQVFSEK